jgi:hypothetical protein
MPRRRSRNRNKHRGRRCHKWSPGNAASRPWHHRNHPDRRPGNDGPGRSQPQLQLLRPTPQYRHSARPPRVPLLSRRALHQASSFLTAQAGAKVLHLRGRSRIPAGRRTRGARPRAPRHVHRRHRALSRSGSDVRRHGNARFHCFTGYSMRRGLTRMYPPASSATRPSCSASSP